MPGSGPTHYRRAPIVEAVVAFDFQSPVSFGDIKKATLSLPRGYANRLEDFSFQAKFDLEKNTVEQSREPSGFRLTSGDQTEILVLSPQRVIVSKLAPYPGWDKFVDRVQRDWEWIREKLGVRALSRVGVRFINRIDVPSGIPPFEFTTIGISLPGLVYQSLNQYSLQTSLIVDDERGISLSVNSGTVLSPVPNHYAILIDLDVGVAKNVPMRLDSLWQLLSTMRGIKNDAFEALITDRSRDIFR